MGLEISKIMEINSKYLAIMNWTIPRSKSLRADKTVMEYSVTMVIQIMLRSIKDQLL
jgi:hypothetical protein